MFTEADAGLAARFVAVALKNPLNVELLRRLSELGLRDCWLVAGCLFQAVWNEAAGRAVAAGVKDYDIFYYDGEDLSWKAEDRVISRVRNAVADLDLVFDIKNQARVHVWYQQRFGAPYPRLLSALDGIDRFLVAGTCVALASSVAGASSAAGTVLIYAPYGLADIFMGVLRPNPLSGERAAFLAKAENYRARWPKLQIDTVPPAIPDPQRRPVLVPTLAMA